MDRSHALKEIFEVAKSISSTLDVDTLLKRIDSAAERLLNAEVSSIMLLDDDGQTLSFKLATGEKGGMIQKMKVKVGQGIAGLVAKDRKTIIVNDAASDPRFTGQTDRASGFVTKSIICAPMFNDGSLIGVMEVLNKKDGSGFLDEDRDLLESLSALAAVSVCNARLAEDQRNFFVNVIEVLISAIEARDSKLAGHSWRVAQLATTLGRLLHIEGQAYKDIYYGALLHDIGLINMRNEISVSEGIIIGRDKNPEMNHPRIGAELIRSINLLKGAIPIIQHHLAAEQIPLGARVVAVAEAVEEMRLAGIPEDRIVQMLERGRDTRYDPKIIDVFMQEFAEA
jgi:HD-GYP domain-containing protein (c-di-GMP phosphodiesterase class II)